tara:strand:+ start:171 stop:1337 length:1167 start_codon:yes stop_codon:yes gene_type:complete
MTTSSETINHAQILGVTIKAENETYDITGAMLEINLYESLDMIAVMGDLNFLDNHRLYESVFGGEEVTIRFDICEMVYDITLVVYAVTGKNLDDRGGLVQLKVAEKHYIENSVKSASGMYDDNCSVIMSKLLSNLGVSTIVTDSTKQSKTLSIPHMKPFEAIELIRTQTSSPSGQKMFVYGTLSQGVIIDSLDKMLERKPMESMFRYEVGESPLNPDDINEKISILARTIHKVTVADSIDALAMVKDGFFGVRNNSIDMFNKTMVTKNYGSGSGLVEQGDAPRVNSVTNSSVSSLGWDMGEDRYTRAKNHSSFTLENLLVSPYMFRGLSTIGHAITVVFPNNTYNVEGDSPFDLKRSGEFIITHSRLSIKPGKATFTMNAVSKVRNNV